MKIVKQLKNSNHCGLVFFDQHSAKTRSLINTIGKYDITNDELMILDDETNISKKFRALLKSKVYMKILPMGSNYYVSFDATKNTDTDTGLQESNKSINEMISFKSMINGVKQLNPVKIISNKDNIANAEPEPTTKVNKPFPEPVVSNSKKDIRQPIAKPELDYTKHEKMLTRYDNERREKLITNTLMLLNKE